MTGNLPVARSQRLESAIGAEVVINGRTYLNFGGSCYLGALRNPDAINSGEAALQSAGLGYQFPRELGIATRFHKEAEAVAASFFGTEDAVYLASGYLFGFVALAALKHEFDIILFDEWAHFSLREAIAASGLPSYGFKHLDAGNLRESLRANVGANERPLVVTDGLYATFGEVPPLGDIAVIASDYDGHLLIDESHSFGVLGPSGRGAAEHFGLLPSAASFGGSTCKAFGSAGGVIPAAPAMAAKLRATPAARGGSVGSPAAAAICASNLNYIHRHPGLLRRLRHNTAYMKRQLREIGLPVGESLVPIVTFVAGADRDMATLQQRLMSEGIHVFYTNYIGAGAAGVIRCSVFADHSESQIDDLAAALKRLL